MQSGLEPPRADLPTDQPLESGVPQGDRSADARHVLRSARMPPIMPRTRRDAAMPHVMNTYAGCRSRWRTAAAAGSGTPKAQIPRRPGRIAVNTLGHATRNSCGAAGADRQAHPHLQLLRGAAAGATGREAVRDLGSRGGLLLQFGARGQRGRAEDRAQFGHDKGSTARDHRLREAFHGRSIATLSATGNPKVQKGFEPLVEGFVRVPLNDLAAIEQVARDNPNVVAVFLETIRARAASTPRAGITCRAAPPLRRAWLAADAGRGAVRHRPHRQVVCAPSGPASGRRHAAGQGLGSGVPIGAIVVGPKAVNVLGPGNHGTTFAATRWPCAPAWKRCASWKKTACWPRRHGGRSAARRPGA